MLTNDLFNTDYERRLNEGAVDQLEQRRIDDLNMKMDELAKRVKTTADKAHRESLLKAFLKCKEERDSYYKIKETAGGIGQDLVTPQQRVQQSTPQKQTPIQKVGSTVKHAANWVAGKGGPGKEGPTYEEAELDEQEAGPFDVVAGKNLVLLQQAWEKQLPNVSLEFPGQNLTVYLPQVYSIFKHLEKMNNNKQVATVQKFFGDRQDFLLWMNSIKQLQIPPKAQKAIKSQFAQSNPDQLDLGIAEDSKKKDSLTTPGNPEAEVAIKLARSRHPTAKSDLAALVQDKIETDKTVKKEIDQVKIDNDRQEKEIQSLEKETDALSIATANTGKLKDFDTDADPTTPLPPSAGAFVPAKPKSTPTTTAATTTIPDVGAPVGYSPSTTPADVPVTEPEKELVKPEKDKETQVSRPRTTTYRPIRRQDRLPSTRPLSLQGPASRPERNMGTAEIVPQILSPGLGSTGDAAQLAQVASRGNRQQRFGRARPVSVMPGNFSVVDESQMSELDAARQDIELMTDRQFYVAYGISKAAFQQKYRALLKPAHPQDTPMKEDSVMKQHEWMKSIKQQYPGVTFAQNKTTMKLFAMVPGRGKVGEFDQKPTVNEYDVADLVRPNQQSQTNTPPRKAYSIALEGKPGRDYQAEKAWEALNKVFPREYPYTEPNYGAAQYKVAEVGKRGSAIVKTGINSEDIADSYVAKLGQFVPAQYWRIVGGDLEESMDDDWDEDEGDYVNDPEAHAQVRQHPLPDSVLRAIERNPAMRADIIAAYKRQHGITEKKLGQNRPKLGTARDIGKSVRKFRAQSGLAEGDVNPKFIIAQVTRLLATEARRMTNAPMAQLLAPVMKEYGLSLQQIDAMVPGGLRKAAGEYGIMMKESSWGGSGPAGLKTPYAVYTKQNGQVKRVKTTNKIGQPMNTREAEAYVAAMRKRDPAQWTHDTVWIGPADHDLGEAQQWQGNLGAQQAQTTDHTMDEAIEYIKGNYPFFKKFRIGRAEPGFRADLDPAQYNRSNAQVNDVDSAMDYLQLRENPVMSGSEQISYSLGYSWHTNENRGTGIAVFYYEDRGMGWDEILVAAKDKNNLASAVQVFRDAGVIPTPKTKGVAENDQIRLGDVQPGTAGYDAWYKSTHKTTPPGENPQPVGKGDYDWTEKQKIMPKVLPEAGNPAQQAAIAIAMKKEQGVAEAQTDYSKRRARERDVDAGKPVKPLPKNPQTDYARKRAKEKRDLDLFGEEKTRLDPKCWTGKKIGNPKTKMKGGVRVNNCVPAESIDESYTGVMQSQGITDAKLLEVARKIDLFAKTIK